ncbi:MAG TPA: SDR family oxidoreductase [Chloroflexi bacterium]|nr:SDR family oxidoreductase [Chloroflexota bacterium]
MTLWLVTGGAGFIGSHLVETLVARGERVRVLDDFSTGRWENLAAVRGRVEVMEGDVRDPTVVTRAMEGVEVVAHLAAVASVQASLEDPKRVWAVNVDGTLNLLEAARTGGVRRFVFASSAAVYGDHEELPLREDLPLRPLSPYAACKVAGEALCRAYCASYGLPTVVLRFFNVYGPRQVPHSPYSGVVSIFVDRMRRGLPPVVYGDGHQTRDFVYVTDVVEAVVRAVEREEAVGEVFNVAGGAQTSVLKLVTVLNHTLGTHLRPAFAPPRPGEVLHSLADVRRIRETLGWTAQVGLEEGLERLGG